LRADEPELADVLRVGGEIGASFAALWDEVWTGTDLEPALLELCRLRTAQLLRCSSELGAREERAAAGLHEDKIAALSRYQISPLFTERERACLAYAERVVADPSGITTEELTGLRAYLSDAERVGLTLAITLFEGLARGSLMLGVAPLAGMRRGLVGQVTP
jgi:alkylhydroperoxidase family enzyme